ncbi:type VII secretion-associated serine protease mycosin [Amycolatopsis samaneae]
MACAAFTLLLPGGVAAAQETELPRIPQALRAGQPCTPSSGRKVAQVPWQLPYLGADRVWPLATGAGVTVAVVDTGADTSAVPAGVLGDAGTDCVGHGTVLAGLVAAPATKDGGPAGLAPGARVLAARGTDRFGVATAASIAGGLDAAVAAGARIICVGPVTTDADPVLRQAVDRAVAAGALVVAAAGPDGAPRQDTAPGPYYPAAFPGVLAVTAVGPDGKPDAKSSPKAVAGSLAAPGNLVVGTGPGGGQVAGAGPAFAAAQVAAAAALIRSYRPEVTSAEILRRLRETAYPQSGVAVVDPLAAVTGAGAADGAVSARQPVMVRAAPDPAPAREAAGAVVSAVVLAVGLLAAAAVVVPLGRRRGWRAGRQEPRG